MKVAIAGSVSSTWHTLRALITSGAEITAVVGLDESHAPRVSDFRSMRELAREAGLPFLAFHRMSDPAVHEFLRAHPPDLLFVVGLSQLAPPSVRALAPGGAIGFHPTPLPKGRGRAPVPWTILLEQPAAANLFFLSDDPDAGDIIDQRPVEVRPDDYAQDLIDRTNAVLEQMVHDLCPALRSGRIARRPQNHAEATWYGRRTPEDGRVDWRGSTAEIHRLVRAVSRPYPGAFTDYGAQRLIVWRAQPHERRDHVGTIGQIVRVDPERGLLVQTGDGLIWLTEVTDAAGAMMKPCEIQVGRRLGASPEARIEELELRVRALENQIDSLARRPKRPKDIKSESRAAPGSTARRPNGAK
jgi:methionyl-tRNA formyltransferase